MIPKPQRGDKRKVISDFYPLQKAELIALRKVKLINNVAFVYLALCLENSQGDCPISVSIKEFAWRWRVPESNVYEAITKINQAGGDLAVVKDWKPAMGQVLAYSGFYPEHQKRIHLFARYGDTSSEYTLLQPRSICDGLGITVTFEEVQP